MGKNRKKAIEIMTNIATENVCDGCGNCNETPCDFYEGCARLYDSNYRPAGEVRKETAKEFLAIAMLFGGPSDAGQIVFMDTLKAIAREKFGVEDLDE